MDHLRSPFFAGARIRHRCAERYRFRFSGKPAGFRPAGFELGRHPAGARWNHHDAHRYRRTDRLGHCILPCSQTRRLDGRSICTGHVPAWRMECKRGRDRGRRDAYGSGSAVHGCPGHSAYDPWNSYLKHHRAKHPHRFGRHQLAIANLIIFH